MEQDPVVSSSGSGSSSEIITPFFDFEAALIMGETSDQNSAQVTTSDMTDNVPHFDADVFQAAVQTIQKGHELDNIWHYCLYSDLSLMGIGKEGSEFDPFCPITPEKFEALSQKYNFQSDYHIVRNCIAPRILTEKQEIEICYPLTYWMVVRRPNTTYSYTMEMSIDNIPIFFPHAKKMLGRATRQALITQWQSMKNLGETIETLRQKASLLTHREQNGEITSATRIFVTDLPLTQDPIIVTWYDTLSEPCNGDSCVAFAQSGCLEKDNWLFSYTY